MKSGDMDRLACFLAKFWDNVRQSYEPSEAQTTCTFARTPVSLGEDRFWCFSLQNNRFCACKGASHKSNGVYLVVDIGQMIFYQKCHDMDCRDFRSSEYPLPSWICASGYLATQIGRVEAACAPSEVDNSIWSPAPRKRKQATATPSPSRRTSLLNLL